MRIRRKPWARPELAECPFCVKNPPAMRENWHYAFPVKQPIHLELGCGKGGFIAKTALGDLHTNYIGVDIKSEVLVLAKRNIEQAYGNAVQNINNLLLTSFDISRINLVFSPSDAVSRMYINFPNPWPKERHKKHRLTHTRQLMQYREFLANDGEIFIKTDDGELYRDTLLYLEESGFYINYRTTDYYLDFPGSLVAMTEHEKMFTAEGLPIYYIEAVKEQLIPAQPPN